MLQTIIFQIAIIRIPADLDIKPAVDRIWLTSGETLNISCHYKGVFQQDITWFRDNNILLIEFTTSVQQSKTGNVYMIQSFITKHILPVDSGNITCAVDGFSRQVELRVLEGKSI